MPKEINCLNFRSLFSYLEKQYGDWGINTVIHGLVDNPSYLINDLTDPSKVLPITRENIVDMNYWVSNDFSIKLLQNVRKVVKAQNPLFDAGRGAVRENLSKCALFIGKLFGPVFLAKQAVKINSRFNRTKQIIPRKVNSKELAFELHYFPNFKVTKDVCNWNLGIYTELMNASGVMVTHAEEVKCIMNGDDCCEFRLKWKQSNFMSRMIKGISIWGVKKEVQTVIEEYEGSLRERDRLIDELVNSEKKYRSLFENTATANAIIESDFSISLVNSEFENMTGYLKKEIEKKLRFQSIVHDSDCQKVKRYLNDDTINNQYSSKNFEFRLLDRKGEYKEVICKIGRIPNSLKMIASMMDMTEMKKSENEKKRLETKLVRAEKMEAIGILAGGVAHDLNNVLSGIVGYPELLLLDLPEESNLRKSILTIRDSGIKAAAIVQDLLALARRDVPVNEVVNINDIINNYLESPEYDKMMSFHPKVQLKFESDKNLLNILGAPFNLFKAIMNLITNAAEATKDGGEIRISTKNVCLENPIRGYDVFQKGDYVLLSVRDTGIGIPKKDLERIFEPFFSKKVMGRSGTGLGMTVVWGTVNDHGGHIDVISDEGKGTTFDIYFPVTRKAFEKKEDALSLQKLLGNGESILVVDDEKEQRELASNMLERLGYNVNAISNGEDAVEFIRSNNNIDLLVLDMIMYPGIDGLETLRRIQAINTNQKTIIVSGFSETNRVKDAQSIGAGAYIRKPYLLEILGSAVKNELQK